jgi:tetratricopeptide (TPR) repeat protein
MATAKRDQILQEAEKLASRGKLDAAVKEYRRAVEQAPNDTNTLNRLGDLLQRASRIPEAVEVYQRIADHFSEDGFFLKAIAIYKKINRLDPQRTETYEKLADLYFKQGLVVEGRQQLLTLADWFTRSKQVPETIRVFRRLAELEPTNLQARAKLVDLLVQAGEVDALAAEIEPLGKALLGRGMLDEAIKLFHRALDLKPKDRNFVAPCIEALAAGGRLVPAKELADLALQAGRPGSELARAAARHARSSRRRSTAWEIASRSCSFSPTSCCGSATLRRPRRGWSRSSTDCWRPETPSGRAVSSSGCCARRPATSMCSSARSGCSTGARTRTWW